MSAYPDNMNWRAYLDRYEQLDLDWSVDQLVRLEQIRNIERLRISLQTAIKGAEPEVQDRYNAVAFAVDGSELTAEQIEGIARS